MVCKACRGSVALKEFVVSETHEDSRYAFLLRAVREIFNDASKKLPLAIPPLPEWRVCQEDWPWMHLGKEQGCAWPAGLVNHKACEFHPEQGLIIFTDEGTRFSKTTFLIALFFCLGAYSDSLTPQYQKVTEDLLSRGKENSVRELINMLTAPMRDFELSEIIDTLEVNDLKTFMPSFMLGFLFLRLFYEVHGTSMEPFDSFHVDGTTLSQDQKDLIESFERILGYKYLFPI